MWRGTLLAPLVITAIVLAAVWIVRDWAATAGVVGLAVSSLFFGKFIILGGSGDSAVLLPPEELVAMVVVMGVMGACWLVYHRCCSTTATPGRRSGREPSRPHSHSETHHDPDNGRTSKPGGWPALARAVGPHLSWFSLKWKMLWRGGGGEARDLILRISAPRVPLPCYGLSA